MPTVTERPLEGDLSLNGITSASIVYTPGVGPTLTPASQRFNKASRVFDVIAQSRRYAINLLAASSYAVYPDQPYRDEFGAIPDVNLRCYEVVASPLSAASLGATRMYKVEARYRRPNANGQGSPDDPSPADDPVVRWGFGEILLPYEKAKDPENPGSYIPITNTLGDAYSPAPTFPAKSRTAEIIYWKPTQSINLADLITYDSTLNETTWTFKSYTIAARQALMAGVAEIREQDEYTMLSARVEFRPNGLPWNPASLLNYKLENGVKKRIDADGVELEPDADSVFNTFELDVAEKDFNALGIW